MPECEIYRGSGDRIQHCRHRSRKGKEYSGCKYSYLWNSSCSQFAIGLLLELCHHIGAHSDAVKAGEWSSNPDWCFWKYPLVELAGKTMGIIGFGRIGQETGKIAQALGMKVLAYDSYKRPELESETCHYVELDELLKESDVISLHCPLFPSTEGIINKDTIAKMKDGV